MKREVLAIVLIVVLGFGVYANSFKGPFVWDDITLIEENVFIKNPSFFPKIFTQDIGAGAGRRANFYRPVQMLSYMLDYSFWRLNPFGFHLTNTIVHILVAIAAYLLILLLFKDSMLSLLTGLLFVSHPIHTEAVTYISGRADLLAALFMLACLIFYVKASDSKRPYLSIVMILAYILALLSRENALILPVLLVFYHYTFRKRLDLKNFLPILAIALAYLILRLTLLRSLLFYDVGRSTFLERLPGFFAAIARYGRLLVLPLGQHMEYGEGLFPWSDLFVVVGICACLLLSVYLVRNKRKDTFVVFCAGWFFITLLPQANLYPIGSYMAEHWLYLPSLGFFLILARVFTYFLRRKKVRIGAAILFIALSAFYSFLTLRQNAYWQDSVSFYEKTLQYAPYSARLHNNLGKLYRDLGRYEKAIALYQKALDLDPYYADALNNLGIAYYFAGKKEEAIDAFKRSIEYNPDGAEAYNNLGNVYKTEKDLGRAIEAYQKAIAVNPDYAKAYYNLGNTYIDLGKKEEALIYFKKAVEFNPDYPEALTNLGNVYKELGRPEMAIVSYKKALAVSPTHATAHNNLAIAYFEQGRFDLAIIHCDKALELGHTVRPEFLELLEPYRK